MARLAKLVVVVALVAVPVLVSTAPAQAATIDVSPSSVAVGGQVTLSGDVLVNGQPACDAPGEVTLISQAFNGLGEFAGVGAVTAPVDASGNFTTTVTLPGTTAPGTYEISGRCGGGNLGVTATLTVVAAQQPTIDVSPSTVAVGGQVTLSGDVLVNGQPACDAPGEVTLISQAFNGLGEFAGVGAVIAPVDASGNFTTTVTLPGTTTPGTYEISGRCGGGNLGVTATLTVVATAVTKPPAFTG